MRDDMPRRSKGWGVLQGGRPVSVRRVVYAPRVRSSTGLVQLALVYRDGGFHGRRVGMRKRVRRGSERARQGETRGEIRGAGRWRGNHA